MNDNEALVAMKIYQQRHGGNLAEISILFANVVSALKEAAQHSVQADVLEVCVKCGCGRHNHPDHLCNANYQRR